MPPVPDKIVLPYSSPDLDGVACAVAYSELLRKLGEQALPWLPGRPDAEATHVLTRCEQLDLADEKTVMDCDRFVLVDGSGLSGLPREIDPLNVVEIVDHRFHFDAKSLFPNAEIRIEQVGAAATMIAEGFQETSLPPSNCSANLLYGAIQSNTQSLKGSVTTERDREISEWLYQRFQIPPDLVASQFAARRSEILEDLQAAVDRELKSFDHPTGDFLVSQLELPGAEAVIKDRIKDIREHLAHLRPRAMLNLVDSDKGTSYLIIPDTALREVIGHVTGLRFDGVIGESPAALIRKQILFAMKSFQP